MKRITFTIDGHSFSTDFSQDPSIDLNTGFSTDFSQDFSSDPNINLNTDLNTEEEREEIIEEREKCVKEILEVTGRHYSWYKENTGNKNWILYDTEQYEVRNFDDIKYLVLNNKLMDVKTFLCVRRDFKGKLHLPINASTCSFMFVDINVPELDITEFDTTNIVDMDYMFLEADLGDRFSLGSTTITQANDADRNTLTLNTEGVTSMSGMFKDCKVKYLNLSSLRTNNVIDFSDMFCS